MRFCIQRVCLISKINRHKKVFRHERYRLDILFTDLYEFNCVRRIVICSQVQLRIFIRRQEWEDRISSTFNWMSARRFYVGSTHVPQPISAIVMGPALLWIYDLEMARILRVKRKLLRGPLLLQAQETLAVAYVWQCWFVSSNCQENLLTIYDHERNYWNSFCRSCPYHNQLFQWTSSINNFWYTPVPCRFVVILWLLIFRHGRYSLFCEWSSNDVDLIVWWWNVIPSILRPYISLISQESIFMDSGWLVAKFACQYRSSTAYLAPNGGFSAVMSWTDEAVLEVDAGVGPDASFRRVASSCGVSVMVSRRIEVCLKYFKLMIVLWGPHRGHRSSWEIKQVHGVTEFEIRGSLCTILYNSGHIDRTVGISGSGSEFQELLIYRKDL